MMHHSSKVFLGTYVFIVLIAVSMT